MTLTKAEREQFEIDGYLVFDGLLPGDRLAHYVAIFDELVERGRTMPVGTPHFSFEKGEDAAQIPGLLHKIQGVCEVEPRILELATEPVIIDRVRDLLGPELDVFGTKFFPKLAGRGTSTDWHQDNYYFGTNTERIVSCGIYLQACDKDNGCLRVIPGSHRDAQIREHRSRPTSHGAWIDLDDSAAVDVVCAAGTVVMFSANLLHGAYNNTSERSRYSTAWHYLPGDLALERFPRGGYGDRHILPL